MKKIPGYVFDVAEVLHQNSHEAHLVGGSLRDILLDTEPNDYDIATNALPEQVMDLFPQSIPTGAKFGTIRVLVQDRQTSLTEEVEVTTYRSEKDYVGGRWPSSVEFSKHIYDDLKRRDFTVNAMALNLNERLEIRSEKAKSEDIDTLEEEFDFLIDDLLDPFNGKKDLEDKVIHAVGIAKERFQEDGLRPLRACRLASVLNFQIEESTFQAISETLEIAAMISKERIRDEFIKLVEESPKPSYGLELMRKSGLLQLYIPELLEGYQLEHNSYHTDDVYMHYLHTVDVAPKEIRIAALFHDIGKPRCKDGEHFYSHDKVGADMTREILERLKFPKKFIQDTCNLVRWHMFFIPERTEIDANKEFRNQVFKEGWSDAAIRRFIRNAGGQDNIENLLKLRVADAIANPHSSFDPKDIHLLAERIAEVREQDSIFSVKDLKVDGNDLQELGIKGKAIGEVLQELLEEVTEDIQLNTREKLILRAKSLSEQHSD